MPINLGLLLAHSAVMSLGDPWSCSMHPLGPPPRRCSLSSTGLAVSGHDMAHPPPALVQSLSPCCASLPLTQTSLTTPASSPRRRSRSIGSLCTHAKMLLWYLPHPAAVSAGPWGLRALLCGHVLKGYQSLPLQWWHPRTLGLVHSRACRPIGTPCPPELSHLVRHVGLAGSPSSLGLPDRYLADHSLQRTISL
jgi:hypothetical protein